MPQVFTAAENGSTISLETGETFEIVLSENPTTGYRWHVTISPPDIVSVDDGELHTESKAVGAGGERHLRFHAMHAGSFALACRRYREWESAAAVAATFTISGSVR